MWATGSRVGHTAVALRHPNGTLFIIETTDPDGSKQDVPPPYGVRKTEYREWLRQYHEAGYSVGWVRLRSDLRKSFDVGAAWKFFNAYEGLPFGNHSFLWAAADHWEGVPPPYSLQSFVLLFYLVGTIKPDVTYDLFVLPANQRFREYYGVKSDCKTLPCVTDLATRLGTNTSALLSLPEMDSWLYPEGPSLVCVHVVMHILKAGGVFGAVGDQFQIAEFVPKDLYQLSIFDPHWVPPAYCPRSAIGPFCQVMGKFVMELPSFNTIAPYPHMNERCIQRPPGYLRTPPNC